MTRRPHAVAVRLDRVRDAAGRLRGVLARRRPAPPEVSRFMDYGPDWPPVPVRRRRHPVLRRCVAIVVVYAAIWGLGSVLLEVRLYQLHEMSGHAATTYTTIDR
jgi:hypothetical protein